MGKQTTITSVETPVNFNFMCFRFPFCVAGNNFLAYDRSRKASNTYLDLVLSIPLFSLLQWVIKMLYLEIGLNFVFCFFPAW